MNWKRINKTDRKKYRIQKEKRSANPFGYCFNDMATSINESLLQMFSGETIKSPCKKIIKLYIAKN